MAIPRYSQNPPIIAPTRLAPKLADGDAESLKVVEKMMPAKKTGSGTARSVQSRRPGEAQLKDCLPRHEEQEREDPKQGSVHPEREPLHALANMLAAMTMIRTPATTAVVTNQVVPKKSVQSLMLLVSSRRKPSAQEREVDVGPPQRGAAEGQCRRQSTGPGGSRSR